MKQMNRMTKIIKGKLIFASICAIFPIVVTILLELPSTSAVIKEHFNNAKN